jgi:GxxExxY protein
MPLDRNVPHADLTYRIIGCAMRVHSRLGPGLKEHHYQRALTTEISVSGMAVSEEYVVEIYDEERWIGRLYYDQLVEQCVVVEVEAFAHMLTDEQVAQVITYLAAAGLKVGLLFNFGRKRLEYKRILAPKDVTNWQQHARRYAWRPPSAGPLQNEDPQDRSSRSGIEDSPAT